MLEFFEILLIILCCVSFTLLLVLVTSVLLDDVYNLIENSYEHLKVLFRHRNQEPEETPESHE